MKTGEVHLFMGNVKIHSERAEWVWHHSLLAKLLRFVGIHTVTAHCDDGSNVYWFEHWDGTPI